MKRQNAFTLVELLVVIAIIAVLMSILMPALSRVKDQAKDIKCRANLKQWGLVWAMYTEENDFKFPDYLGPRWMFLLADYYGNSEGLLYCPMTTRTYSEGAPRPVAIIVGGGERRGSYTINEWIYDSDDTGGGRKLEDYWRTVAQKGLSNAVVMGDGIWRSDGQPTHFDDPPNFNGEYRRGINDCEIRFFCVSRHDAGTNILFMDWSIRHVGLKELWTLKWNRGFDTAGPWTLAGNVRPTMWPVWMRSFRDY